MYPLLQFFLLKIEIPQCSSKFSRYAFYFHLSSLYLKCDETRCPVIHKRKHEKECFIYWVTRRNICEMRCGRYDFWIVFFFWQQENHFHDECRNRMSLETGRLDAKSFRYELKLFNCTKIPFISSIVSAWTEKNILGEYSSFFKLRTWNYLHLDRINLYRNDL